MYAMTGHVPVSRINERCHSILQTDLPYSVKNTFLDFRCPGVERSDAFHVLQKRRASSPPILDSSMVKDIRITMARDVLRWKNNDAKDVCSTTASGSFSSIELDEQTLRESLLKLPSRGSSLHKCSHDTCSPCAFFHAPGVGCQMGAECKHCHLCPPGEFRRRKNQRSGIGRTERRHMSYLQRKLKLARKNILPHSD